MFLLKVILMMVNPHDGQHHAAPGLSNESSPVVEQRVDLLISQVFRGDDDILLF